MARIRSIKPEFWTSEQIAECSPNTRLLFIGLWSFCDDGGVHPANAMRLKMEIFPGDALSKADVQAMVDELKRSGLLDEYEVSGKGYWRVTGWNHQKIDQPTYKYPHPDGKVPQTPNRRRKQDGSPNTPRTNGARSPQDVDVDVYVDVDREKEALPKGATELPTSTRGKVDPETGEVLSWN